MKTKLILATLSIATAGVLMAQTITTAGGWKLVGAKEGINTIDSFSNSEITSVWTYNESSGTWKLFYQGNTTPPFQGIESLEYINDGDGFWINTKSALTIDTISNTIENFNIIENDLIGSTYYYLDKNISSKIYEQNMTIAMEQNSSLDYNSSYMADYQVHKLYFEPNKVSFDTNQSYSTLFMNNELKIYADDLKESSIKFNSINNGDINTTISISALNPFDEQNITSPYNKYDGTFILSKNRPTHLIQAYTYVQDANGTITAPYFGGWEYRSADINNTSNQKIANIGFNKYGAKSINIINDNNTSAIRLTLFPYDEKQTVDSISYSKETQQLLINFTKPCCTYSNEPNENQLYNISNPMSPTYVGHFDNTTIPSAESFNLILNSYD